MADNDDSVYSVNMACGGVRIFKSPKQMFMWVRLHKKRCETCRNAETVNTESSGTRFRVNDPQDIAKRLIDERLELAKPFIFGCNK